MKYLAFIGCLIMVTVCSCTRDVTVTPASLDGKWKMISVKDNNTGVTSLKPADLQKDVEITIASTNAASGKLSGNTPTNEVWGDYTLGNNASIAIPSLTMTKVMETTWGFLFVDNIHLAKYYNLNAQNTLNIITTEKTLTFQKL
jgi:hypothetical protein